MASEIVVFGISHVDIPVRNIEAARRIYVGVLGFTEKTRGEGWLDLDAGTVALRLVEVSKPEHKAAVRVLSDTVEASIVALTSAGCARILDATRTPENELVASVRDPDGNLLYVWRKLTEDEYDVVPPLPKEMTWAPDAEALLKSLLLKVPALFRALARWRVVRVAEELAERTNVVTREEVIRGFILASPKVTRGRNRQPLLDHGIDVDKYRADWEAD